MKSLFNLTVVQKALIDFIDRQSWVFAKTMAEIPHYYIVREYLNESDKTLFDDLAILINDKGYLGEFQSQKYTYLEIGKYKYWVLGNVINRDVLK